MTGVTYEQMRERQAMPLEAKVKFTESRIKAWYLHYYGDVYVSFSGGKDSTVLRHIVKGIFPDVPAVFCDTGLEYPEVRELALRKADVVLRPKMNFKQVIEKYGYPIPSKEQAQFIQELRTTKSEKLRERRLHGRGDGSNLGTVSSKWIPLVYAPFKVSGKCCDVMKKAPFKKYSSETGRKAMIAVMACESLRREQNYMRRGCNVFDEKDPKSSPMAIWTEQDVLRYIKENGIEYAACYGEIAETRGGLLRCTREDRTGCMFCMFGIQFDGTPNRFQRMERDYPKQYDYCINKLGIGKVLDYVGIDYRYQPELFEGVET